MDPLEASHNPVDAFGVFKFDLNVGQTCEFVFPHDSFHSTDLKTISMLSFPDSQSLGLSGTFDCVYCFSYCIKGEIGLQCETRPALTVSVGQKHVQCYVYFRQMEDAANARGYYQKSFVLISSSSRLYETADELLALVRSIGNKFYIAEESGCGREVLIDTYSHLDQNNLLRLGSSISEVGTSLTSLSSRSLELSGDPLSPSHGAFALESIYLLIQGLWHIWEAILLGLPVLVYCPGRADLCSRTVLSLKSLIAPLEYVGDIRPFLSIFDPDYDSFRSTSLHGCIVGVTSPMACQQLSDSFRIILTFNYSDELSVLDQSKFVQVAESGNGRMYVAESITSVSSGTRTRMSSLAARFSLTVGASTPQSYRLVVPPDIENVCNKFVSSSDRINRALISRYFAVLTRDFIMPFIEYIETDSATLNNDMFRETPTVPLFVPNNFLSSVSVGIGRHLSVISTEKLRSLYSAFIRTATFNHWLSVNQKHAIRESVIAHAQLICNRMTEDKVLWMSANEKQRAGDRISSIMEELHSRVGGAKACDLQEKLSQLSQFINS